MSRSYLRRYTDLTALIYLLSTKRITLLDPESWDDSNDSHYLEVYREKMRLGSILALCFTETDERYQYWRVFGNASSGVCIQFKRSPLLNAVRKRSGLVAKPVEYVKLADLRDESLAVTDLPFLKRRAFADECEFRMIFGSTDDLPKLDIAIPLSCVDKITLSPWLHASLFDSVRETLRSIEGCAKLNIVRSTLIGNDQWKAFADAAT